MNLNEYYDKLEKVKHLDKYADAQVELLLTNLKVNRPFAFARFNDGEMMGIDTVGSVVARGDQIVDESLHKALKEAIQYEQPQYYVGMPCSNCFPRYAKLAKQLVKQSEQWQLNAVAMTNRNWVKFVVEFPKVVNNNKIIWISGNDQNLEFLKNKQELNIIKQLKIPSKNSWNYYDEVKKYYENIKDDHDIVIVSLGPAARVFVREMFEKYPEKTYIDIGSTFDPFTRNVWHNCHKGWLETGFNFTKRCNICN